jgi:hypothetical protein
MESRYQTLDDEEGMVPVDGKFHTNESRPARFSFVSVVALILVIVASVAAVSYGGVYYGKQSLLDEVSSASVSTAVPNKLSTGDSRPVLQRPAVSTTTAGMPAPEGVVADADATPIVKPRSTKHIYTKTDSPTKPSPTTKPTRIPTAPPVAETTLEPTFMETLVPTIVENPASGSPTFYVINVFPTVFHQEKSVSAAAKAPTVVAPRSNKKIYTKTESPTKGKPTKNPSAVPTLQPTTGEPSAKPTTPDSYVPTLPVNPATGSPTPWWYRWL